MPNRLLKESICYSDDLDKLTPFEENVFYRLIVRVDDYGRLDARPGFLKSTLYVTKPGVTEKNVDDAVHRLASVGLVRIYHVDGKPFLLFPKWQLHQTIRAKKSKYPTPVDDGTTSANICMQMISDDSKCLRNPIQSESNSESESNSASASRCREKKPVDLDFIQDERLKAAFSEFIEHRKQIRKPMSQLAVEKAYHELLSIANSPEEQVRILDQSIVNGWQGIFPLKYQNGNQPRSGPRQNRDEPTPAGSFAPDPDWLKGGENHAS